MNYSAKKHPLRNNILLVPIILLLLTNSTSILGAASAGQHPNVIVVMTDDQGYGDFGFTGNPYIRTPHIDSMAERSARLSQFYVSPVCAPTRASLMTGRYNYRTRAIDTWNGHAMMDPNEQTLAEILRDAGYATGLFGKWHLGDNYPLRPQDQGFEEVLMHRGGGIGQPSDPDGAEDAYTNPILFHNGERKRMRGYCTDIFFDHAMAWMEEMHEQDRPFFIYLPTNAPHGPFGDVPEELYQEYRKMDLANDRFPQERGHPLEGGEDLDNRARIYAMITNIDDNMGRLFQQLHKLNEVNNTIVVFLVDNGPNGNRYVAGFRGRKTMIYEGGIRSPALWHFPGTLEAGHEVDQVSAHIDLAPTIIDACSVATNATEKMDGVSMWPLLTGKKTLLPDRPIVIQAHRGAKPQLYHNFALRTSRWKLLHASGFQSESFEGDPKFELYDMEKDPYETRNVVDKYPEMLAILKNDYIQWFADVSSTRPDNYLSPRIQIDPVNENPVILTRQDGEHYLGKPFGRESLGVWRLKVIKEGSYSLRYRFAEVKQEGTASIKVYGKVYSVPVSNGDTEVTFEKISFKKGQIDLYPMISLDEQQPFSPWKVDIVQ